MGYQTRDYFRDGSYTRAGAGGFLEDAPTCKWILIITVAIFVGQIISTRAPNEADVARWMDRVANDPGFAEANGVWDDGWQEPEGVFNEGEPSEPGRPVRQILPEILMQTMPDVSVVQNWLELDTNKVLKQGQVWRLLTNAFCHDRFGIYHILINMLLLYWFGRTVESLYGSKEFLIFYLVAAVVASLAYLGLEVFTGERIPAIGASGAVMAIMCVYTMWYPRHKIFFMYFFPMEMRFLLLIYIAYDLHPILMELSGTPMPTGVAHAAHLGGLAFGFLYWKNVWQLERVWNRVSGKFAGKTSRSNLKVHRPGAESSTPAKTVSDERFEIQVDEVLEKISREGEESLTERERKVLIRASQRYRDR